MTVKKKEIVPVYEHNPFIESIVLKTKEKEVHAGRFEIEDTERNVPKHAILVENKIVDSQKFVKLYEDAIISMTEVGKAALKLFNYLIKELDYNEDKIQFSAVQYSKIEKRSLSHTYRLIRELIDRRFIARSVIADEYYININLVCKGNRIVIINRYIKKYNDNTDLDQNKQFGAINEPRTEKEVNKGW